MKIIKLLVFLSLIVNSMCNAQENLAKIEVDSSKSKNIVSFNYADLLSSRIAISYERLLLDGKLGIRLPIAVSYLNDEQNLYFEKPLMQGGLDINYYPLGQKRFSYFTGFSGKAGIIRSQYDGGYCPNCFDLGPYDNQYGDYLYYYEPIKRAFVSGYVNNGLQFQFNRSFSISGQFGIGVRSIKSDNFYYIPSTNGELNLRFRF